MKGIWGLPQNIDSLIKFKPSKITHLWSYLIFNFLPSVEVFEMIAAVKGDRGITFFPDSLGYKLKICMALLMTVPAASILLTVVKVPKVLWGHVYCRNIAEVIVAQ